MIKALLLSGMLLSQTDGGTLVPAVVRVQSADPGDGGVALPEGWWVSPDQMLKTGTKIAECDQPKPQTGALVAVVVALAIGFGSGVALTLMAVRR